GSTWGPRPLRSTARPVAACSRASGVDPGTAIPIGRTSTLTLPAPPRPQATRVATDHLPERGRRAPPDRRRGHDRRGAPRSTDRPGYSTPVRGALPSAEAQVAALTAALAPRYRRLRCEWE